MIGRIHVEGFHLQPLTLEVRPPIDLSGASSKNAQRTQMEVGEFQTCRFCQQKIRANAIKCRYCGSYVQTTPSSGDFALLEIEGSVVGVTEAPASRQVIRKNYWRRHWQGELPLRVSYWINGVVTGFLVAMVFWVVSRFYKDKSLATLPLAGTFLYGFSLTAFVWQITGTWRSASNYLQEGGRIIWERLAKGSLVLSGFCFGGLTLFTLAPQIVERAVLLAKERRVPPYEFRILPGGTEIEFVGGVRTGASEGLERILLEMPQARMLRLTSSGGITHEAFKMARSVSDRELTTHVSRHCLDAATLVFLAGKARVIEAGATLGFCRADLPLMTAARRQQVEEISLDLFREAGVTKEFANRALTTREMWFPSKEEAHAAGVTTAVSLADACASASASAHQPR